VAAVEADVPVHDRQPVYRDALPLLAGVGLLMAGAGLTSTLLGLRAGIEGFAPAVTGVVLAGYYMGFLLGSLVTPSTIERVGHVRVFAGLASLGSAAVLVHVVRADPLTWFGLRLVTGLCISGLYVVTETWLNGAATNQTRGSLLAAYMVVVTGGLGAGQLLLPVSDPGGFAAFVLASVLVSLAVVPVTLAGVSPPHVPDPGQLPMRDLWAAAPLAVVGAVGSGFATAAVVGGGTVYASAAGLRPVETSGLLGAALGGALLLQVPLGRWSDRTDRRRVVAGSAVAGAVLALAGAFLGPHPVVWVALVIAGAGGVAFPLYSLSNAHLNDYLDPALVVPAGARMVLLNGAGAVAGPIVVAGAIGASGPDALFVVLAVAHAGLGGYALWRTTRRAPVPEEDRAAYVPVPSGVTPAVMTLAAVADDAYPVSGGAVEAADAVGSYRERGSGAPVIIVGRDGLDGDALLLALAADGFRAVVVRGPGGVGAGTGHVLGLLHDLGLPCAAVVGLGDGRDVVAELLADHADRLEAAVLVGGAEEVGREEEVEARPVLLLPDAPAGEEERLADDVAGFLRHVARRLTPG
jgi:MFS family permease